MNLNKYIGIPFKSKGRDMSGIDCYGLVYQFYAHEKNITLPLLDSYSTTKDTEAISQIVEDEKGRWQRVENPKQGDVVVISIAGKDTHVGIYLEGNKMLHAFAGTDTCIETLHALKWKNRISGYFRFE